MYRILPALQDAYITNKYVGGSRCLNSNTGQAGTIDLYKLYNETFLISASQADTIELTRGLIKLDYSEIANLTGSSINLDSPTFKCFLSLKDVYGGQTTPSNYTLSLIPLANVWNEGRGQDVIAYRDLDVVNFITASISNGLPVLWNGPGAAVSGVLGLPSIDVIVSGNLGNGLEDFKFSQFFQRGDEDLLIDITKHVSASVVGLIENNGFRLSFSDEEETNTTTYFVKRFGTRHVNNRDLKPTLIVKVDDAIKDYSGDIKFNTQQPQEVYTYFLVDGVYQNFFSGSQEITGSNSLQLQMIASHPVTFLTTSWSVSHNASITYTTSSKAYFQETFPASQVFINGIPQVGLYKADVQLSTVSTPGLGDFLSGSRSHNFELNWVSLDGTYVFAKEEALVNAPQGVSNNITDKNYVVNITNLRNTYSSKEKTRLRIFVQDYNTEQVAYRLAQKTNSVIIPNMKWRLLNAYTRKVIVPFDESTKCSFDSNGMYFDFWFEDYNLNEVYEFELQITENGKDIFVTNDGFRFKVIP